MSLSGFLLLFSVAGIYKSQCSPKLEDRPCYSSCSGASDLKNHKVERFTYRYSTVTTTTFQSSASGSSGLSLDCVLDIDILQKCLMTMKLRNVQIKRISGQKESSPPNLKELRVALERSPLQFVFQSGKIPEICPQEGEAMWALNIKRAILSMLQSSHTGEAQEAVMETDVFGTCLTNYDSRGPVLVKTRDLRQCSQHWLTDTWLRSVPLPQSTEQLVDSTVQCVQRYRDRAMEEVNCTETIHLVPLSSPSGTVQAESHSILRLLRTLNAVSISPGAPELVFSSGLQFEKEAGAGDGARAVRPEEAAGTVRRLCAAKMEVQQAEQFISLVFQLRALTPDTLNELWQEASYKCRDDWQPLVDALPACGSEACVALMTQIILSSEVEEERISSFLSSLGFIPRPSPRMIRAVTTLIEGPEPKPCALMGVSSLVHLFCSMSQLSCGSVTEVQAVIAILQERLGDNCRVGNPRQLGQRLIVLRAVGNAGLAAASLSATLTRCAQDTSGPLELRLAALHAFRRIPCSADRSGVLQLYHTLQEDAEVRIAAYQQAMLCPSPELLHSVRDTLRTEPSSQVGAFVWSHLTQIQETQDPLKQALRESLPDDIIDKDFEVESWKYSSYMDATMATGYGAANVEGAMVFSPSSFVPRSAMANMTVHVLGQAVNLLEINIRAENVEPLVKTLFSPQPDNSGEEEDGNDSEESPLREKRRSEAENEGPPVRPPNKRGKKQGCQSSGSSRVRQVRAKFTDRLPQDNKVHCSLGIKILGNELIFLTCDDISTQVKQFSLSLAGMAVKLLKGQEVQYNRRLALATEEFVLPSLSGLPIRLALNMSASISLRVKGSADFKNWAHFLLSGYIKPSAQVAVSARMGVEGVCGRAGVEWVMVARTSTSLDGGVRLQEGQDLKVSLNTPEDTMDIIVFSSRIYSLNGEGRKELAGPKPRIERTACTHPEWSRLIGWQLCSQISYPLPSAGLSAPVFVPKSGPVSLSIRLVKLDKGLRQYLLEAGYSLVPQRGSRLPSQASLHLFMGTPQSELHRDLTVDVRFNSITRRLSISLSHPQKTLLLHGEIDEVKSKRSGKVELLVDNADLYYIKGMTDLQTSYTEQRFLAHLEAKLTKDSRPAVLSANLTRGPGKKMSVSVTLKNVLKDTASISVQLERRLEEGQRQYSVESELLLPGLLGAQVFGLLQHGGPLWTSALRLRYGLRGDARILRHECSVAQKLRSELGPEQTYLLAGEHELHCSDITVFNHKVQLRHEESPAHIQSALDLSYGKHWDEINNQRRLLLSQTFRNRSQEALTSYLLEFSLQFPERQLSYSTQLQHSHLRQRSSESSTHLKVNYNGRMPLVAGLHWKDSSKANLWRWEGSFNMDTPWLYLYTAHKLSQPQRRAYQLSTEITARKWINIRSLVLEGFCRARGREREGRLHLYTPTVTYFKVTGSGEVGELVVMASGLVSSLWTPSLQGKLSLQDSGHTKALQLALSCARQELNITASLTNLEQKLKKKQLLLKMVLTEPKSPQIELEVVGSLEELIRDRDLYRKQGTLRLRHPLRQLPQSLLLQETFTVDRRKGQYVLVSRAVLNGNEETRHTLTLGYRPGSPSVCSALIHPYSAETIPHDLELCVHVQNNHTQQEVEGRVRINHKDRLTLKGSFQNRTHTAGFGLLFQVNVTHLLEHQVSPIVNLEAELYSSPRNATGFDYRATGKAVINNLEECQFTVQLNGSSNQIGLNTFFTHPYHSRIPKDFKAHATAARHGESNVNGSLHVEYNGEEKATFEADIFNTHEKNNRIVGLKVSLRQKLLPAIEDLYVQLTGKASNVKLSALSAVQLGSGSLQAQLSGTLTHGEGSLSGSLQHTIASLSSLPPSLGLAGSLRRTLQLSQGELSVNVSKTVYGLQLLHHNSEGREYTWQDPRPPRCQDGSSCGIEWDREAVQGEAGWMDRLCVRAGEQSLCVSLNSSMGREKRGLHGQLSHSFAQLLTAGLPSDSRVHVSYLPGSHNHSLAMTLALLWGELSLETQLRRGQELQEPPRWQLFSRLQHNSEGLRERGVPTSVGAEGHCQVEVGGLSAGLAISVEEQQRLDVSLDARSSDGNAQLAMSLRHHMGALAQALPSELQVNCTGETTADQISGLCSGTVAGQPLEVRAFLLQKPHRRCLRLELRYHRETFRLESCYSTKKQAELTASLTHSSRLLNSLSIPGEWYLRVFLKPKPNKWHAVFSLSIGHFRLYTRGELRVLPIYRWHWLASYIAPSRSAINRVAEVRGSLRPDWCNFVADVSATWSKVTSSFMAVTRCGDVRSMRVTWVQVREAGRQRRTAVTVVGEAKTNVFRGSVGVEHKQDSLHSQASVLLLKNKAELSWSLQHHWTALQRRSVPGRMTLHGSGRVSKSSLGVGARVSLGGQPMQLDMSLEWGNRATVSVVLQHALSQWKKAGIPKDSQLSASATHSQARLELASGKCTISANGSLLRGHRKSWSLSVHQHCPSVQSPFPTQFSVNGSMVTSRCGAQYQTWVQSGEERGQLSLTVSCASRLLLNATLRHSLPLLRALHVPPINTIFLSAQHSTAVINVTLGQCGVRVSAGANASFDTDETQTGWDASWTNHCSLLQRAGLPLSLATSGSLSLRHCQTTLSASLRVEEELLTLQLGTSCEPRHSVSGALRHSFSQLSQRGLPSDISLTLSAPSRPSRQGTLLLKAGQCRVRASGDLRPGNRSQWVWTADTECPLLKGISLPAHSQFNGSLLLDSCSADFLTELWLDGQSALLELKLGCSPLLRLDGVLTHRLHTLQGVQEERRLVVTAIREQQGFNTSLQLTMDSCELRAGAGLHLHSTVQGTIVLDNNCTALQEMGSPLKVEGSGSLAITKEDLHSQLSITVDEIKLQALLTLRAVGNKQDVEAQLNHSVPVVLRAGVPAIFALAGTSHWAAGAYNRTLQCSLGSTQISEAVSVVKSQDLMRVDYQLNHTVDTLRGWGIAERNAVQTELAWTEAKTFTLHSQLGDRHAILGVYVKDTLTGSDITGGFKHSWVWLQERGVPRAMEVHCSMQGSTPNVQYWAQVMVDGEELLSWALNASLTARRLALLVSHSLSSQHLLAMGLPHSMETTFTTLSLGSQRRLSLNARCDGRSAQLTGELGGWGTGGLEARVNLQHSGAHQGPPDLKLEVWGRLAESQLSGSLALNSEPNSTVFITLQGEYQPLSKGLHVKALHNIPELLHYLPFQLDAMSKLNQSGSRVQGLARLSLGRGDLWLQAGLTLTPAGYWEVLELNHSLPQLKFFPRHIDIQTSYERGNRTQRLEHRALWVGQELRLRALYAGPGLVGGGGHRLQVQMSQPLSSLPHQSRLDVLLEQSVHRWMNSALLGWSGQDGEQQVSGLCSRSSRDEGLESKVSVRHPFNLPLSQLDLYSISHTGGQEHQYQALVSWNEGLPVNVTLSLQGQRDTNSSRGQACVSLSPGQLQAVLPVVEVHACGRLLRQGQGYNQALELSWGSKKITESLHYQSRGVGIHSLQLEAGVENVFPSSCPTQRLLARLETNCRDRLEHHFQLGLCSPNPSWTMSGLHRVGLGRELLYSRTSLAVSGRPLHSSFTLTLTNNSARALRNFSLSTELLAGGAVLELLGSVSSSNVGLGLLLQASLDRTERVLLRTGLEGHCLQATASYSDGTVAEEALAMALCVERSYSITLEAQRHVGGARQGNLATISLSTANQSLTLSAQGCAENLRAAEVRLSALGSKMRTRLLDRIRSLQHHLLDFRSHMQHSTVLQELSEHPLHLARGLEALLLRVEAVGWGEWRQGALRRALTGGLPLCSARLQEVSQQIQDELKRPLSTLAEAYQDVWGRRPGAEWQEKVTAWAAKLGEMLPAALEDVQLKAPLRALLGTVNTVMDMAGQQAVQWAEARLARALAGVRRRLATLYRYSPSRCVVVVQVPLPGGWWARQGGAGVTELLLEEAVLRPLRILTSLTSLSPAAELYRLQRRVMDSPFQHQALLAAGRFVVSFDGRLFELPSRCALLLAHDLVQGSFTVLLSPEAGEQRSLLVDMNNTIISILPGGQVEVDCQAVNIPFSTNGVTVKKDAHIVEVSNQKGASVSCDLQYSVCSVTLSGWQHGVSAGLMGTNDNEAGNEMTLPDWSKTDNVTHFIHSWQLRPQCRSDLRKLQPCPTPVDSQPSCRALFASQASPLGHCFRVVDPGQFHELCQSSRCDSPPHSAPCSLAAAYVHLCRRNYVPLDLPPQCVPV